MIAIDTNVLVRILIDDESTAQVQAARKLASKAGKVFIPQIVQVELVWVLVRAYRLTKQQITNILSELYENAAFELQHEENFSEAFSLFQKNSTDFSDCLIWAESDLHTTKKTLYTFDKKFAQLAGVKKLT